jgi:undecaprenyl-diphosphatase
MGLVEGVTEFLPISSTAHLILTANLLNIPQTDYIKSFEIIIQLGAILAVVALYWKRFFEIEVMKRLIVAFIPTGILGLTLYKMIKSYLLGNTTIILTAMALGGLILILLERFVFKTASTDAPDITTISYKRCLALGLFQSIAMIPGVSRSGATIAGGMVMGIPRKTIVEFSFLLAAPTMAAATLLDLLKSAGSWSGDQTTTLAIGFVTAFVTAIFAIKWLLKFISGHTFVPFGIYRIVASLAFLLI